MVKRDDYLPIIQIGDVLVSADIFTECFCCDLDKCKGMCCVEGTSGAPVKIEEVVDLEDSLDAVWQDLSAGAQSVIDRQGVVYTDSDHDLVTSIVNGKDCVFTCYDDNGCCLCAIEKASRAGKTRCQKPISCALYPIRESRLSSGLTALNYNRWDVCRDAIKKGQELNLPLYQFLKAPLIRRFGAEWYKALEAAASYFKSQA